MGVAPSGSIGTNSRELNGHLVERASVEGIPGLGITNEEGV